MTGAVVPTYSLAERDRRWDLARSFMECEGLDALLVFGEHEDAGPVQFYLDTWFTNDRPGAIVVLPRAGEPTALVWLTADQAEYDRRGGGDVLWIAPENRRAAHHDSGGVVALLNELGLAKATTGVVGLEQYLPFHPEGVVPYRLWSAVLEQLPDAEFRPVGLALGRLMMPLSAEEIAVVRYSAGVGDAMARAMAAAAGPGVSESEVYAAGMAAAHSRGTVVPGMHLWTGAEPLGMGPPPWGAGFASALAAWKNAATAPAARMNEYLQQAADDLHAAGNSGYGTAIAELTYLAHLPATNDTSAQRATAKSDVQALDSFFGTPGLMS